MAYERELYAQVKNAILEAKETGYGVSIPRLEDMKLQTPEVVKKNGMYGVTRSYLCLANSILLQDK